MSARTTRGVLYVHSAPRSVCPHIEWALGREVGGAVRVEWTEQPVQRGTLRADVAWEGPEGTAAAVASALLGWERVRFEITEEGVDGESGSRWMHTPALGITHQLVDPVGNALVPEDRIRALLEEAGNDALALRAGLRRVLAEDWDDELEPFRYAGDTGSVIWLHGAQHDVG